MSVVVAYPSLEAGGALLEAGAAQARASGAELVVLHLARVDPVATRAELDRQTRRLENLEGFLATLTRDALGAGGPWRVEVIADQGDAPAQRLLERLRRLAPDLLVVGRTAPHGDAGAGPGPVGRVLERAVACPVLTVPLPRGRHRGAPG